MTLSDALVEARKSSRVCPQPQQWARLYEMLPNKTRRGAGWTPALPLILAAWWEASDLAKATRLREHLEWAQTQGVLAEVYDFLRDLPEDQWHHQGE
jgi:hypothetical protein